jgi:hypothetical protein
MRGVDVAIKLSVYPLSIAVLQSAPPIYGVLAVLVKRGLLRGCCSSILELADCANSIWADLGCLMGLPMLQCSCEEVFFLACLAVDNPSLGSLSTVLWN